MQQSHKIYWLFMSISEIKSAQFCCILIGNAVSLTFYHIKLLQPINILPAIIFVCIKITAHKKCQQSNQYIFRSGYKYKYSFNQSYAQKSKYIFLVFISIAIKFNIKELSFELDWWKTEQNFMFKTFIPRCCSNFNYSYRRRSENNFNYFP